jgi:Predicted membrane protein
MTKPRTIGNMIAPPRFLLFLTAMIVAFPILSHEFHRWALGAMGAFDIAALLFLASCAPLLGTREARVIREHAAQNDANRIGLLVVTGIVMTVLMTAIAAEAVGHNPQPFTKALIISTLALAWLFSNLVYALHYAHLVYMKPDVGCVGLEFPRTTHPVYWDFVYFSFTCGMAFATSDVQITETHMRKTVTSTALPPSPFNIGVLAFTINVLGSSA